tara:strand:- start:32386 stop:32649 length:264 start_codon:yes stop_codon:yes gene_type:complete
MEKSIWERALATDGVTVPVTGTTATRLRQRLYHYRILLREQSKLILQPNDPDYGRSAFDRFYIQNKPGQIVVAPDPIQLIQLPDEED